MPLSIGTPLWNRTTFFCFKGNRTNYYTKGVYISGL